jgi:two-component system, chemotaxis family, response regulator Rcp1
LRCPGSSRLFSVDPAQNNGTPIDILLIEDQPGDARLTQEAFRNCKRQILLHHAWNGIEALSFLRRDGINVGAPQPSLILLDLNMPEMNGQETLTAIKSDPRFSSIPILVLTTSDHEADVLSCYRLGASCYLRKPAHWDAFTSLIEALEVFWFTRAKLPRTTDDERTQPTLVGRLS